MFPAHPESTVRRARSLLALVPLLVVGLAPAHADAALTPIDPVQLHASQGVSGVVTGVSPTGEGLVIFRNGADQLPFDIGAVSRSATGSFAAVQPLSSTPSAEPPPRIAFNGSGGAFVHWGIAAPEVDGQFAERPAGGSFSIDTFGVDSSNPACGRFVDAQFAPDGTLLLACSTTMGAVLPDDQWALIATRPAGSHVFDEPALFPFPATDDTSQDPVVAVGADGTRAVALRQDPSATNPTIRVWVDPAGAAGPAVTAFPLSALAELSDVAVLSDGTVIVLYADGGVSARVRPPGDATTFGPAEMVDSLAADGAIEPDGPGGALLTLRRDNLDGSVTTLVASRAPSGAFSSPVALETATDVHPSELEVSATGIAVITRQGTGGDPQLAAWIRPSAGGTFSGPHVVAQPAASGSLSISPTGDILAGWSIAPGAGDERLMAGGLDAGSPPSITDIQAPSTALAGEPVSFYAAASDWSGIREIRWVFADGEAASGDRVSHAFARPGTYQMLVRAVDRAGNASEQFRTIRVVAAAGSTAEPDRTQPMLTVLTKARLTLAQFRRGVTVRVSSNEPATVLAELLARAGGARISAVPFNLALGSRTARRVTNSVTLKIKPSRALVGKARRFTLRVRVTATDDAGNRRVTGKTIRVAG